MREPSRTVPEFVPAIDSKAPSVTTIAPIGPTISAAAEAIGVFVAERFGIDAARAAPLPRPGKKSASEITKPFVSDASEVRRAIQFIHPVSKPTKSPNAVRA